MLCSCMDRNMEMNKGHVVKNPKIHQLLPKNHEHPMVRHKVRNGDLWQRANQDPVNIQIKRGNGHGLATL